MTTTTRTCRATRIAGAAPPGVGILLSGVRNYTVTGNHISNNDSWGVVVIDFRDTETPPSVVGTPCAGGTNLPVVGICYYRAFGNEIEHNAFSGNGGHGNLSNGDIVFAMTPVAGGTPNCAHDNIDTGGSVTSDLAGFDSIDATCGPPNLNLNAGAGLAELVCATPAPSASPATGSTARPSRRRQLPEPDVGDDEGAASNLPTMPDPCAGVPANP